MLRTWASVGLLAALQACSGGQTTRGAAGGAGGAAAGASGTSAGADGGAGGQQSATDAPDRDDHTPLTAVPACVQPAAAPSRALTELRVGTSVVRATEHDCAWTLGEPLALPLTKDDPSTILFHFDVNGDEVEDLFFGALAPGDLAAPSSPLVLLTSRIEGTNLSFDRIDCGEPWLAGGRSTFMRDLNDDAIPDFVFGRRDGISAVLNLPGIQPEVLHFDWPASARPEMAWASILDVAVGDFYGEGRPQIAVGYDRTSAEHVAELGVLLFRDRSATGTYGAPEGLDRGTVSWTSPDYSRLPAGYVTAVDMPDTSTLFSLVLADREPPNETALRYISTDNAALVVLPQPPERPTFIGSTRFGAAPALVIGGSQMLQVHDVTPGYPMLLQVPASTSHDLDHELGGGNRSRSYFVLDIDGDGDDDFLELGLEVLDGEPARYLWVHARSSLTDVAPATAVPIPVPLSWSPESPFIAAGPMRGRLLISDSSYAPYPDVPASVWPLVCDP